MRAKLFSALAFLLLALHCGCATRDLAAEASDKKAKVGIVFDIGGKDDRSFNAAANSGMLLAKKDFPIILRDVEPGDPTSIEPALRAFSQYGYNLITGVGFAQGPILTEVAKDYPQLHYVLIDSVAESPNVASLLFKEHQGSFLVGMIAASRKARTFVDGLSDRAGAGEQEFGQSLRAGEVVDGGVKRDSPIAQRVKAARSVGSGKASKWHDLGLP